MNIETSNLVPYKDIGERLPDLPTDARGALIDISPINSILARLKEAVRPRQVWLFGSRARGEGRPGSDWDLFVVVPDDLDAAYFDPLFAWGERKASSVSVDLFLCRVSAFREDRDTVNTLAFDAAHEGVLIYERCTSDR